MRSPSVFASLIVILPCPLAQAVTESDTFVKHETLAAPAALRLGDAFQIAQDAALEVIDLGKTARQQIGAGFFAADATGAEHCDARMFRGIEMARGKILELAKVRDFRIDRAFERAERDFERIARV